LFSKFSLAVHQYHDDLGTWKQETENLMAGKPTLDSPPTEVFSALSDPIRWSIITQMAQVEELACVSLESTLPVSKPTISYHIKILQNAGLIETRKAGRNYYYCLRRDVIRDLLDGLWELVPAPRLVGGRSTAPSPAARRQKGGSYPAVRSASSRRRVASHDEAEEAAVLTW
jgi:DNA-binding transcriptional ArsR family regulator